jgi:hypothetical protein
LEHTADWPFIAVDRVHGVYAMRYPTQLVSLGMNLLLAGVLATLLFWRR